LVDVSASGDARNRRPSFLRRVSPPYFAGLGVRLKRGRLFTSEESARILAVTPVVVSEAFAARFWPGLDPLGKRFFVDGHRQLQVVGLVADAVSLRFGEKDGPLFYEPLDPSNVVDTTVLVAFSGDPATMARTIQAQVRGLDPQLLVMAESIRKVLEHQAEHYSFLSRLAAILAGLAFVLCLTGLYGVAAIFAARRTHEIGVRQAMGAQRSDIIRLFLVSLARPLTTGLLVGWGLASVLSNLLSKLHLLPALLPIDILSYGATSAVVVVAALSATFLPGIRAARLDPWHCLRDE
jgi:putative ABC transport system permease protein